MQTNRIIQNFHNLAVSNNLQYMIIGGFAASYWGTPRFTADIDIAIEEKSFDTVQKILESLSFKLAFLHPKNAFAHFIPPDSNNFRIDFMLLDSETWNKIYPAIKYVDLGFEANSPIVSAIHLIAMKMHASKQIDRADFIKDLNDVAEIMINQKISFDELEKNDIIKRYGTETTVNELKRILASRKREV